MNKAVFLDRDGVINEDYGYVYKVEDFKFVPRTVDALKLLKDFKLIIITNQSGIGRGYYTEEDFHKFNDHIVSELKKEGIKIEKTYFCPHGPDEDCDCRKPKTKYIEDAKNMFDIDLSKSFVVGDHPHDVELGKNAGCKAIYVLTGHGKKHKSELIGADFIAHDLYEATQWIINAKN